MRYVIFSIGQFFSSDLAELKKNLTAFYKKYNRPDITGDDIWSFIISHKDDIGKTHLHDLRMGGDLFDFWEQTIQVQFPIDGYHLGSEREIFNDFQVAWVSMCRIKQETFERVNEFIDYINEHDDIVFLLISHTNHAHLQSIKQQIPEHLRNVFVDGKIKFITSMDSKKEAHLDTLRYAFDNNIITHTSGDEVISCLNTINVENLPEYISISITLSEQFDLSEFESHFSNHRLSF